MVAPGGFGEIHGFVAREELGEIVCPDAKRTCPRYTLDCYILG